MPGSRCHRNPHNRTPPPPQPAPRANRSPRAAPRIPLLAAAAGSPARICILTIGTRDANQGARGKIPPETRKMERASPAPPSPGSLRRRPVPPRASSSVRCVQPVSQFVVASAPPSPPRQLAVTAVPSPMSPPPRLPSWQRCGLSRIARVRLLLANSPPAASLTRCASTGSLIPHRLVRSSCILCIGSTDIVRRPVASAALRRRIPKMCRQLLAPHHQLVTFPPSARVT